jgi:lysophospholipid acyltransferase (LPLAT)-like uncharacterized protein
VTGETPWHASRRRRVEAAAIAAIGAPLAGALGRTWRWRVDGAEHLAAVERLGRPPIMAFWHGRILPATIFFRDRGIVVITSENFDGEWIARIIRRFGYGTARGSSSRGGVRALVQLKRDMAAGRAAAFTVDGPRGPVHRVQPGCIWLAKATGNPIVPFHVESRAHWTARSWDRTQIPKPFTTVTMCIGAPVEVAPDLDEAGVESARAALERVLLALVARARELAARQFPDVASAGTGRDGS